MKNRFKLTLFILPLLTVQVSQGNAYNVPCPTKEVVNETACKSISSSSCERTIEAAEGHGKWEGTFPVELIQVDSFEKAQISATFVPMCTYKGEKGERFILRNEDLEGEGCLPVEGNSFDCSTEPPRS